MSTDLIKLIKSTKTLNSTRSVNLPTKLFGGANMVSQAKGNSKPSSSKDSLLTPNWNILSSHSFSEKKISTAKRNTMEGYKYVNYYVEQLFSPTIPDNKRWFVLDAPPGTGKTTSFVAMMYNMGYNVLIAVPKVSIAIDQANYLPKAVPDLELGVNMGYKTGEESVVPKGSYPHVLFCTNVLLPVIVEDYKTCGVSSLVMVDETHDMTQGSAVETMMEISKLLNAKTDLADEVMSVAMPSDNPIVFCFASATVDPLIIGRIMNNSTDIKDLNHIQLDKARRDEVEDVDVRISGEDDPGLEKKIRDILNQHKDSNGVIFAFKLKDRISSILKKNHQDWTVVDVKRKEFNKNPRLLEDFKIKTKLIAFTTQFGEMGITFPEVSFVIDDLTTALNVKIPCTNISSTVMCQIDNAVMIQRRGRVGRTRAGVYYAITMDGLTERPEAYITDSPLQNQLISSISINMSNLEFHNLTSHFHRCPPHGYVRGISDVLDVWNDLAGFGKLDENGVKVLNTLTARLRIPLEIVLFVFFCIGEECENALLVICCAYMMIRTSPDDNKVLDNVMKGTAVGKGKYSQCDVDDFFTLWSRVRKDRDVSPMVKGAIVKLVSKYYTTLSNAVVVIKEASMKLGLSNGIKLRTGRDITNAVGKFCEMVLPKNVIKVEKYGLLRPGSLYYTGDAFRGSRSLMLEEGNYRYVLGTARSYGLMKKKDGSEPLSEIMMIGWVKW